MICFVTGEYPPDIGGVGDYTARLRTELAVLSYQSEVITRRQVPRWDARALSWLLRHAQRTGVLHIQYQPAAFDLLGDVCLVPLLMRTRPQLRVVTTFHDARVPYLFKGAGLLRPISVRLLAQTSHAVVASDERDLRFLRPRRGYQVPIGSNVECAPPAGYSRAAFRARLGIGEGDLVLVYFGLLNSSKGLATLLDAFDLVQNERADAWLMLVGGRAGASDPTDQSTAIAVQQRLRSFDARVLQTGYLPPHELSAHMLAADIAVLPFVDGASPRRGSLLACAAHGLPIISTQPVSAAVPDAVHAVGAQNPRALAAAALEVGRNTQLAQRLRAGSRELTQRTSWRRIAQRHLEVYREVGWHGR